MRYWRTMLQRFLAKLSFSSKQGKNNAPQWSVKNQHLLNNMNEIQLLNGHTDIVRLLVRIDASRCVLEKGANSFHPFCGYFGPFTIILVLSCKMSNSSSAFTQLIER